MWQYERSYSYIKHILICINKNIPVLIHAFQENKLLAPIIHLCTISLKTIGNMSMVLHHEINIIELGINFPQIIHCLA